MTLGELMYDAMIDFQFTRSIRPPFLRLYAIFLSENHFTSIPWVDKILQSRDTKWKLRFEFSAPGRYNE